MKRLAINRMLICITALSYVVLVPLTNTFTQQTETTAYLQGNYSADWCVINSGGTKTSTSKYTISSSIGEAFADGTGSGFYSLGSGYISPGAPTPVEEFESPMLPASFELSQNYPNPFNPTTTIEFALPTRSFVNLVIYNILGQRVKTLVSEELSAGYKRITWNGRDERGSDVALGIYLYRLSAGQRIESRKMLLLK